MSYCRDGGDDDQTLRQKLDEFKAKSTLKKGHVVNYKDHWRRLAKEDVEYEGAADNAIDVCRCMRLFLIYRRLLN